MPGAGMLDLMNNPTMKRIIKVLFQDNTGKYAVAQPPNIPVYIIVFSYLLGRIVANGPWHNLIEAVNSGAVFMWAYLEIVYGESVFRRVLGAGVMLLFSFSKFYG